MGEHEESFRWIAGGRYDLDTRKIRTHPHEVQSDPVAVKPLNRPEGASWWKVDFHAHSPESFDFGGLEGSRATTTTPVGDWLRAYMLAEVDVVVITDHNSSAGIEAARAELAAMRAAAEDDFRDLELFTGVELTVNEGLHLLAVFDQQTEPGAVDRLLERCNYRGERGDSNGTTQYSFELCIIEIAQDGGLAIPAHVETKGYLDLDARSRKPIEEAGSVLAAEATTPDGVAKVRALGWTAILGSDSHHLDGSTVPDGYVAKYPGSHFTWVKMQEPSLHGLKLALSDAESSIRTSDEFPDDPNVVDHSVIRQISVFRGEDSFIQPFSPWMNAVIGGRGVGKSTVLELLRLAMGRFEELPGRLQKDQSWFSPSSPAPDDPRYWDDETTVEIEYEKLGQSFLVQWSGATQIASVSILTDGEWVEDAGSPHDRFPVLMYSQKQIYETAQDPQSLLRMIDQQAPIGWSTWVADFEAKSAEYRTKRSELRQIEGTIESEGRLRGELADLTAELALLGEKLNSPELSELEQLLLDEQADEEEEDIAVALERDLADALDGLEGADDVEDDAQDDDDEYEEYDEEAGQDQGHAFADLPVWEPSTLRRAAVERAIEDAQSAATLLRESREAFELADYETSPRATRIAELRAGLGTENDKDDEDPAVRHQELSERKAGVEKLLATVDTAKARHSELSATTALLLAEISEHRRELTQRRKAYLATISTHDLQLSVYEMADEESLEADLRRLLTKPTAFDAAFAKGSGLRASLAHSQSPDHLTSLTTLKTAIKDLRETGSESPHVTSGWIGQIENRFYTHLAGLDQHDLDTDLDLWFPEDRLQLKYSQDGGGLQSLQQGSPGQKAAALLAVILQLSDDPLILDQPEDDLDNNLISDLVVRALKRTKPQRQVIVVTHNANVVVNGDAELVVVMEHNVPVPVVEAAGSIQDSGVKDAICLILEGGEPAFAARYKRLVAAGVGP